MENKGQILDVRLLGLVMQAGEGNEKVMFGNFELIAFAAIIMIAFSPLAAFFLPRKYATHFVAHGFLLGMIYFAANGMSLAACITGIPAIIIEIKLLKEYWLKRKTESLLD